MTPAARLRSACYDSMALLTMAHQPPASSNLSTRPRSCPMRSTCVRVRVGVRVGVRVRARIRVRFRVRVGGNVRVRVWAGRQPGCDLRSALT